MHFQHLRELIVKAMDGARNDLHIPRHRVSRAAPDDDRVHQEKPPAADGSDSFRKVKRKCWKRGKMAGNQKCRGKRTHRKGRRLRGKAARKHGKSSTGGSGEPEAETWTGARATLVKSLVSWCFEPSQPQRITSGL